MTLTLIFNGYEHGLLWQGAIKALGLINPHGCSYLWLKLGAERVEAEEQCNHPSHSCPALLPAQTMAAHMTQLNLMTTFLIVSTFFYILWNVQLWQVHDCAQVYSWFCVWMFLLSWCRVKASLPILFSSNNYMHVFCYFMK